MIIHSGVIEAVTALALANNIVQSTSSLCFKAVFQKHC
jgi:hypothetical protein